MAFNSYIYIDKKRILSYYEQIISSNKDEYLYNGLFKLWPERVIESLKTEDSNKEIPRHSLYEKTIEVTQHIRKSNQFSPERSHPYNRGRDYVYYEEELTAQRIKLSNKVSLWISEKTCHNKNKTVNNKHGHLILVEDHSNADTDVKFYGGWGTAQMLSSFKKINFLELDTSDLKEFNLNPIEILSQKNYLIENSIKISAMYRVLSTCRDIDNGKLISTLGYPITISA